MATQLSSIPAIREQSAELRTGTQILSVVCVMAGDEAGFPSAFTELHREISSLSTPTELVVVVNGDCGNALSALRDMTLRKERLQVYVMKYRVDHSTALMAGIENAIGDWVATIDVE